MASRLKSALFGRAKLLTRSKDEISHEKLETLAKAKPMEAVELLHKTVYQSCKAASVLSERRTFLEFFYSSKNRKWVEDPIAFATRREGGVYSTYHRWYGHHPVSEHQELLLFGGA